MSQIKAEETSRPAIRRWLLPLVAGLALAALTIERVWLAAVQPLWFDEAWALMVASRPDWPGVVHEALTDVNAPLYYFLLHAWTSLAGLSDLALRTPGLAAVGAAALVAALWPQPGLDRRSRLAFGLILFAWWGVGLFLDGRCYGLLLALSVAQTLAFAALIRTPTSRRAAVWTGLAALAILTHYYALVLAAVQGVAFLALHRRTALRAWPAALLFVPAFAWLAIHAPRLAQFGRTEVAWHPAIGPLDAAGLAAATIDPSAPVVGLALVVLFAPACLILRARAAPAPLWIAAGASAAALGLTLLSGALHPSLTARYLIPTAPGVVLALVLLAQGARWPKATLAVLAAVFLATALRPDGFVAGLRSRAPYGFEVASNDLMRAGATDVVFAWDHEVVGLMPSDTLARLGGVFFQRKRYPVRIVPLAARPIDDLNGLLLEAAKRPHTGIVWLYNRQGRTSAAAHPPAIAEHDPRWTCDRIGDETVGTLVCWKAP